MSENTLTSGIILGTAGAGAGYLAGVQKTKGLTEEIARLETLKQPIIDKFEQYGYKEGMDIAAAAQEKVNKAYHEMRQHGLGIDKANSEKALKKVYEKAVNYLTKMQNTYNTRMNEINTSIGEVSAKIKNVKNKNMLIGAGVGIGLVVLNKMRKALFSSKVN